MMTLIGRLCALCAVSALLEMALGENEMRGSIRMIGGLLMLHLTLHGAREILDGVISAQSFADMLQSLIG